MCSRTGSVALAGADIISNMPAPMMVLFGGSRGRWGGELLCAVCCYADKISINDESTNEEISDRIRDLNFGKSSEKNRPN